MFWDMSSVPVAPAFHDAKVASVGDAFVHAFWANAEEQFHRTFDASVASFDPLPVAFATNGSDRRLPRLSRPHFP